MNIIGIKLVTGEEVIGKVASSAILQEHINLIGDITLEKPLTLQLTQRGIMLIPYMMTASEGKVTIKQSTIISIVEDIPKEIEDGYLQQTSSITLATSLN